MTEQAGEAPSRPVRTDHCLTFRPPAQSALDPKVLVIRD